MWNQTILAEHMGHEGVLLIVINNNHFTCRDIEILTDRVIAIGLYNNNNSLIQVICSTYMPFYNGKKDQTDLYIETIDALQVLIDQYASIAPIKIIGDLNTPLPLSEKLSKNWYKQKNFNSYSSILYDFLVFNDFIAADMLHKQKVNYTYFCHKNETYT